MSAKSKQAYFRINNEILRLQKKERRDMNKKKDTSKKSFEYPITEEGLILNGGQDEESPEYGVPKPPATKPPEKDLPKKKPGSSEPQK